MYSIEEIMEMIKTGEYVIKEVVQVDLGDVINRSFDDVIDLLDEAICESWIPKLDCYYELFDCTRGFYHASLYFNVEIAINAEEFLREYEDCIEE